MLGSESMLGRSTDVKITSVGRWSVFGELIESLLDEVVNPLLVRPRANFEVKQCACEDSYCGQLNSTIGDPLGPLETHDLISKDGRNRIVRSLGSYLRLRKGKSSGDVVMPKMHNGMTREEIIVDGYTFFDWLLLTGMFVSAFAILVVLFAI